MKKIVQVISIIAALVLTFAGVYNTIANIFVPGNLPDTVIVAAFIGGLQMLAGVMLTINVVEW